MRGSKKELDSKNRTFWSFEIASTGGTPVSQVMNQIITQCPISIRPAIAGDLAFIDALQRKHSKNVGWMASTILEKKIEKGEIIIAEDGGRAIGYCMGQDRYFKRDDVGIIYQMNIEPGHQRGLVGASLLKAMFERSAWGCKLFCCWCAQDLAANKFWEAMGFVPLAFRAGSEKKSRIHIFWQKRIRAGDNETPWWFPAKTDAGAMREDRIVLPIPPGVHWSDEMPRILPALSEAEGPVEVPALEDKRTRRVKAMPSTAGPVKHGLRQYGPPPTMQEIAQAVVACPERSRGEKPVREKKVKRKADPKMVAAVRELRDRWMEKVNAGELQIEGAGKYEVGRMITASVIDPPAPVKQLAA